MPSVAERRPRPYLILFALWLLVFAVSSQTMIIAPILPRIAEQLGVVEARLGLLVSGYAIAVAIVAVAVGPVSDKLGRRRMLLGGAGIMTVALALHGVARDFTSLVAVRVFAGAGGGALTGGTAAYVGDYFPPEQRGWANGWIMSGMAAGQIVGIPLGTALAGSSGFRVPFVGFGAVMCLAFALIWGWVPQPPVDRFTGDLTLRHALAHYAAILGRRDVVAAVFAFFGMFLGTSLYTLYLPTWLEAERGASPREIAILFALGGVATVLAGPLAGGWSDRVGRKRLVIGASLGLAVAMLATTYLVGEIWVAYALFFLLMALFTMRATPFQTLTTEIVPAEQRGSLMSLSMAAGQVGFGLGAAVAGPAFGAYGYVSTTLLATVSVLLTTALIWRFLPETGPVLIPPAGAPATLGTPDPRPGGAR